MEEDVDSYGSTSYATLLLLLGLLATHFPIPIPCRNTKTIRKLVYPLVKQILFAMLGHKDFLWQEKGDEYPRLNSCKRVGHKAKIADVLMCYTSFEKCVVDKRRQWRAKVLSMLSAATQ